MIEIQNLPVVLTGLGLIVAIMYYTLTLRNSTRTRQAQLFMQIYDKFSSPAFVDAFYRFQETREQVQTVDDYYEWTSVPENFKTWVIMGTFFEGIGVLVKENLIEMRVVAELMTDPIMQFWGMFGPIIDEIRVRDGFPRILIETEYLYDELMKYVKEHPEIQI
jgi:hypothetical protein